VTTRETAPELRRLVRVCYNTLIMQLLNRFSQALFPYVLAISFILLNYYIPSFPNIFITFLMVHQSVFCDHPEEIYFYHFVPLLTSKIMAIMEG
jgi:hypothetical protein